MSNPDNEQRKIGHSLHDSREKIGTKWNDLFFRSILVSNQFYVLYQEMCHQPAFVTAVIIASVFHFCLREVTQRAAFLHRTESDPFCRHQKSRRSRIVDPRSSFVQLGDLSRSVVSVAQCLLVSFIVPPPLWVFVAWRNLAGATWECRSEPTLWWVGLPKPETTRLVQPLQVITSLISVLIVLQGCKGFKELEPLICCVLKDLNRTSDSDFAEFTRQITSFSHRGKN